MKAYPGKRANRDLTYLYAAICIRDPDAADRFLDAVKLSIRRIEENPDIGSTRLWSVPALRGIRAWPVRGFEKYMIYYRRTGPQRVKVLRILHGSVPPDAALRCSGLQSSGLGIAIIADFGSD